TGKDIAYYLETQKPTCPVIIHTTNSFGRDAMKFTLQDVGWDTTVIRPSAEISWINDSWFNAVSKALKKTELSKDFLFFEKETGLILPECIKEMYNQFGNGGFGPYDDFMGLTSGHTDDLGNTVLNLYQSYLESDPESPSWNWPKKLLPVCHLGCSMYACLDISQSTVPVLKFDPSGRTGPEATKEDWEGAFTELFSSLHEWIDSWSKKS
ncbi:MAG: SMI1/KNR4 family protein, partial [Planctomycetota bacterium]